MAVKHVKKVVTIEHVLVDAHTCHIRSTDHLPLADLKNDVRLFGPEKFAIQRASDIEFSIFHEHDAGKKSHEHQDGQLTSLYDDDLDRALALGPGTADETDRPYFRRYGAHLYLQAPCGQVLRLTWATVQKLVPMIRSMEVFDTG